MKIRSRFNISMTGYIILTGINAFVAIGINPVAEHTGFEYFVGALVAASFGAICWRGLPGLCSEGVNYHFYHNRIEYERDLFKLERKLYSCIAVLSALTFSILIFEETRNMTLKLYLAVGVAIFIGRIVREHHSCNKDFLSNVKWLEESSRL